MLLNFNAQLLCVWISLACAYFSLSVFIPGSLVFKSVSWCSRHSMLWLQLSYQLEVGIYKPGRGLKFASRSSRPIRMSIKPVKGLPFSRVTDPKWKNTQHPTAHMWNLLSNPSEFHYYGKVVSNSLSDCGPRFLTRIRKVKQSIHHIIYATSLGSSKWQVCIWRNALNTGSAFHIDCFRDCELPESRIGGTGMV